MAKAGKLNLYLVEQEWLVLKIKFNKTAEKQIFKCVQFFMYIKNADFCQNWLFETFPEGGFLRYFIDKSRKPKVLHIAGHKLSYIYVTNTLRPIQAVMICLPMILNTYVLDACT